MKEYQLLMKFDEDNDGEDVADGLYAIHQALSSKQMSILDVAACRDRINTVFDYVEVRKRFDKLREEINGGLSFDKNGFKLFKSTFETLDEVEKALKNKAFL